MTTNQQVNYNIILDSLNYYRQLADQLQDIINSTNTPNLNYNSPASPYNYIEFTDNINESSDTNTEYGPQDSTFENVLNEDPLSLNNDEILYYARNLEESPFSNTKFLDQSENTLPEQYMCYGYMTCNGDDMYLLGPVSDEDKAEWFTTDV